jgi:putative flavoprotein involved in K+ transport
MRASSDAVTRTGLVVRRLVERWRTWAAPVPPDDAPTVAVIGAGPAGLATAALLRRAGISAIVFDRDERIGSSWADRYDSLRLNTVRWMSDLPGLRMERSLGRWVRRDDVVAYLERYAAHHCLECRLGADGEVSTVHPTEGGWVVAGPSGVQRVDGVVMATGHSRAPRMPSWPGAESFSGRLLHAIDYRRPDDHVGVRVLVVGAGSSGGEICVDLAGAGIDVTWAVRSAPQVFPREVMRVPATPFAPIGDAFPDAWVDRTAPWLERAFFGRRDYLPEPEAPMMKLLAECKEPLTADGIVELIRAGRVRVVDAVDDLDATGARLVDGSHLVADHVIAATGYRTALEPLVGGLGVLDADGRPADMLPRPGLGFVGFRIPLTGTLWAIDRDARTVADAIAAHCACPTEVR